MRGAKTGRVHSVKILTSQSRLTSTSSFPSSATSLFNKPNRWWACLRESFHSRIKMYYLCIIVLSGLILSFGLPTMQKTLRNKPYEERLSYLNLYSLEKRRLRGKKRKSLKLITDFTNVKPTYLTERDDSTRMRNNGPKLTCRQVHSDCAKFFTTISGAVQFDYTV